MAKKSTSLVPGAKAIDPTLDALFSSSAGPLKTPSAARYSSVTAADKTARAGTAVAGEDEAESDDEELSEISEEFDDGGSDDDDQEMSDGDEDGDEDATSLDQQEENPEPTETPDDAVAAAKTTRERKRKRKDEHDDLEDKYMSKLTQEEPEGKRQKAAVVAQPAADKGEEDPEDVPVHESLATDDKASDLEKATRTVFLANVSSDAISSKPARRQLLSHLASILSKESSPPEKVESIRFRSVAFSEMAMPKRAAFITGALLEATTKSTNAYAVYSTAAAARKAAAELNGTVVLDRHLRVDSVAHPTPTDHRRCVFVGNLGFVDDETVVKKGADGETTQKKRNKVPADVEEGLWRTFSSQGKVENVRVIRDPKTRVGKGFAYVQFYDANSVESALLLDEKKFPPMLPRALRVTRAKDPRKTALAQERSKAKALAMANEASNKSMKYKAKITPEQQSMAGRTSRLLGRAGEFHQRKGVSKPFKPRSSEESRPVIKTPEQFIFEGRRVSSKDTMPTDLKGKKGKKSKKGGKPQNRGTKRAATWRKTNK